IDVRSEIDDAPDCPTEGYAQTAAQDAHATGLDKENPLYIAIARAHSLHDPNLAATLQNRHHQRIHDSQRCHSQRQAAEDSQEQIEKGKSQGEIARCIHNGEGVIAQLFDLVFHLGYLLALGDAHHNIVVNLAAIAGTYEAAHVTRLDHVQGLCIGVG